MIKDKDENTYKTVIIGSQEWMGENLTTEHYRNGDAIPQVQDKDEWMNLTTGAWCYYENNEENGKTFRKLYNWYALNDPRGLAPEGWHIPSNEEWTALTEFLGGTKDAGGKLKSTEFWDSPNKGATNDSGFSALPGGFRYSSGNFNFLRKLGCFWSSTEFGSDYGWDRDLDNEDSDIYRNFSSKKVGMSIRCIKD